MVGRSPRVDSLVFRDGFFDGTGDQLLHFLRGSSRPLASGHGHTHRNLGILALRHRKETIDPPNDGPDERGPSDLPVLDKKPGSIANGSDALFVSDVCHMVLRQKPNRLSIA